MNGEFVLKAVWVVAARQQRALCLQTEAGGTATALWQTDGQMEFPLLVCPAQLMRLVPAFGFVAASRRSRETLTSLRNHSGRSKGTAFNSNKLLPKRGYHSNPLTHVN